MFVQVIQGQVADRDAARRLGDRWEAELRPGAEGFLGATVGITDDGWLVNVARFDSADAARRNSERPEQGAWWNEFSKCLEGEPTFIDSSDVAVFAEGGRNDAGFVQVMTGRVPDRAKLEGIEATALPALLAARPEVIGGLRVWHGDGDYVEVIYFESEDKARASEAGGLPADLQAEVEQMQAMSGDVTFYDLRDLQLL